MDLIFKGDRAVAVNPDIIYINTFRYKNSSHDSYNIRACFDNGDNWVKLTDTYDSYDEAKEALKTIYQKAIDLAFEYKGAKSIKPIKFEDINIEIRDLKEEK